MLVAEGGLLVARGQPLSLCEIPSRPNQLERRSCFLTAGITVETLHCFTPAVAIVQAEKVT